MDVSPNFLSFFSHGFTGFCQFPGPFPCFLLAISSSLGVGRGGGGAGEGEAEAEATTKSISPTSWFEVTFVPVRCTLLCWHPVCIKERSLLPLYRSFLFQTTLQNTFEPPLPFSLISYRSLPKPAAQPSISSDLSVYCAKLLQYLCRLRTMPCNIDVVMHLTTYGSTILLKHKVSDLLPPAHSRFMGFFCTTTVILRDLDKQRHLLVCQLLVAWLTFSSP